ncbi:DUF1810 family protein [Xylophilus rhododendri]|uniref:DUF1810 family protein n=1 Tax=Xylophilus rhododendri TaxID=2697032 RepID=A0A857J1P0_9BURK|nr:DUF1810 domain-containing protein [Xylophilus rhododendri]QHI97626.1 DUF1810 family protein [Xylophilus rhododendri]
MPSDPWQLQRFVDAQAPVYAQVLAELAAGDKRSHWMWFIFPQLKSLGRSSTARHYGIAGRAEALAYLAHPLLGARLLECSALLLGHGDRTALEILGTPDELKLRSCMTLFQAVAAQLPVFAAMLRQFYGGEPDVLTVAALDGAP